MRYRVDIEDCELQDSLVLYEGLLFSGVLYSLYDDGKVSEEMEYKDGLPHGESKVFYPNGKIKRHWFAKNGRAEGQLVELYENGNIKLEEVREFGVVLSSKKWNRSGKLIESKQISSDSEAYAYVEECRRKRI